MSHHSFIMATLSSEVNELFHHLAKPYYAERVLAPVFVYGLGIGTLLMIASFFLKDGRLKLTALVVVAMSSLAVMPYLRVRDKAVSTAGVRAAPAKQVTKLRKDTRWIFLGMGGLAVATIFMGNKGRVGWILSASSLTGSVAATIFGLWLDAHDAGVMHEGAKTADIPKAIPVDR